MDMGGQELIRAFGAMAAAMEGARDELCALDGVIGDADHGITMALGFGAVREHLATLDAGAATPAEVFNAAARTFLNAVGASAGPLYATAFMRAGAKAKGAERLAAEDLARLIPAMAQGIADRGKGARGDKTMLDAWLPAAEAAEGALAAGLTGAEALRAAAGAAREGAQATAGMAPRLGRAARLGKRAIGHVDPGAASAAILIGVLADQAEG
jgi:dihydroxyacetone kinase-like protein